MPGAHEKLERAEHATHAGGHGGDSNRLFGVTMALIGVLIAVCSAKVGSERNEFTRAMIKQTQAHAKETSASTKLRLVLIELEKQQARKVAARDPQGSWSPVKTFIKLNNDYARERDLAGAWAGKYEPLIEAHFDAAESYERAQLIAEIGIVLASLAVLLASRLAWLLSVLVAVGCIVQLGGAWVHTRQVVEQSEVQVQRAEEAFGEVRKAHLGADEDKQIVERLDPDGNIRQEIEADTKKAEPAPMRTAAEKH